MQQFNQLQQFNQHASVCRDFLLGQFGDQISANLAEDGLVIEAKAELILAICGLCLNEPELDFKQLIDLCVVDYLHYGQSEWQTKEASGEGFSRAVNNLTSSISIKPQSRFALVYHLLSLTHNTRTRLKFWLTDAPELLADSVVKLWPAANWYEREAYDLFGVQFRNHPDLRRLLTDYGFEGYPMRKDFALSGNTEVRYCDQTGTILHEPVSIPERIGVPKVIRD